MGETVSDLINRLKLYFNQAKSNGRPYILPAVLHESQMFLGDSDSNFDDEMKQIDRETKLDSETKLSVENKQELLDSLYAQINNGDGKCRRCLQLADNRTHIVFGIGNPDADLLFVGEAPGRDEDIQGIPFVGKAGQLLTKIIESIGLKRSQVYIANVLKCRPPDNRNPLPDEIESCSPYLFRQIDIIQPKVICALGAFAAKTLLGSDKNISSVRGKRLEYRGCILIPTYHPSFLLRSPNMKREVWKDMLEIKKALQA